MKKPIRQHYFILALFLFLGMPLIGHTQVARWIPYLKPQPAPNIIWQDVQSNTHTLKELTNKVVLINIWATWCQPCLREMPTLDILQKRYQKAGLEVLPIAVSNPTIPAMLKFYGQARVENLGLYRDYDNSAILNLGTSKTPTTYVLNRQHQVIGRLEGADSWLKPTARHIVETLLKEGQPATKHPPAPNPEAVKEIKL